MNAELQQSEIRTEREKMQCPVCHTDIPPTAGKCECGYAVPAGEAESVTAEEFHARLDGLRRTLARVQTRQNRERAGRIAAHVRHVSWVLSALAFVVLLNLQAKDLAEQLPRAVLFSAGAALAVIVVAEVVVLALRKLMR